MLIAFVSISLVVSSIMIGIVRSISVMSEKGNWYSALIGASRREHCQRIQRGAFIEGLLVLWVALRSFSFCPQMLVRPCLTWTTLVVLPLRMVRSFDSD